MYLEKWRRFQHLLLLMSVGLLVYSFWGMMGNNISGEKKVSTKSQLYKVSSQLIKTIERRLGVENNKFEGSIRAGRTPVKVKELEVTYYYVIKRKP